MQELIDVSSTSLTTDRARWLAELSHALDQAHDLLRAIGFGPDDEAATIELHGRIEAARIEAHALRLKGRRMIETDFDPEWIDCAPWARNSGAI